jgi:hypothetical protein
MAAVRTRCSPIGFGRSLDRVLNTPRLGVAQDITRVDGERVAPCLMQPGQDEDLGADDEVTYGFRG